MNDKRRNRLHFFYISQVAEKPSLAEALSRLLAPGGQVYTSTFTFEENTALTPNH